MALIAVLDTTGRGTWWSWHLASMLAGQDFEVTWVEADKAERTAMLLGPLPARAWLEGKLSGLAHLTPEVVPREVLGQPIGLKLLPGCPPETERPAGLDQALLAWARGREEWVIADLGRRHEAFAETIRHCDLLVVVTTPEGVAALRQLGETLRGRLPGQLRYAVIDERDRRTDRSFLRRRLPAAFRSAWLGGSPVVDVEPVADTEWCVGVAQWAQRQQDDGTPIFRLPPGDLEVPHAVVVQAKADWWRIAERVARALGVQAEARVLAPLTEPPPAVVRFCVPESVAARMEGDRSRAPGIAIEEGGFLASPDDGWGISNEQRPLHDVIKGLDCALILGEPGIGKTEESKRWLDRIELHGQGDFRRELDELVERGADVIALDAADEWTGTAAQLADPLGRWLDKQTHKPRLIIFGRSGDRMDALHQKLTSRYPEGRYARLTLLPLRAQDVEPLAAVMLKASAAGLLDQIRALHLETLAARPLTLTMLARLWARGQELPGDRVKVYRQGLDALIEHRAGDIAQVMKVARPLAWVVILCGKSRFRFGEVEGELNLHDLQAAFKGPTRADIEAALGTPLFVPSGSAWSFAHRTYAEYLAATFAVAQGRPLRRLIGLIEIEGLVPEQLSGLAGWLAALDAGVARALIAADPGLLLELRAHLPEEVRQEWLRALVAAARQERADLWHHDLRVLLGPGVLGEAIHLIDEADELLARYGVALLIETALREGGHTRERVVEHIEAVAARTDRDAHMRADAVRGLYRLDARAQLARLIPLASGPLQQDPTGALRGELLETLWDLRMVAALQVVRGLEPIESLHQPDGTYEAFLEEHGLQIIDALSLAELPEALAWAAEHPWFSKYAGDWQRWPVAGCLLQKAWDCSAEEPAVTSSLGLLLDAWYGGESNPHDIDDLEVDWYDPFPSCPRTIALIEALFADCPENKVRRRWTHLRWLELPPTHRILDRVDEVGEESPQGRVWIQLALIHPHCWTAVDRERLQVLATNEFEVLLEELRAAQEEPRPVQAPFNQKARLTPTTLHGLIERGDIQFLGKVDFSRSRTTRAWDALTVDERNKANQLVVDHLRSTSPEETLASNKARRLAAQAWQLLAHVGRWPEPSIDLAAWTPVLLAELTPDSAAPKLRKTLLEMGDLSIVAGNVVDNLFGRGLKAFRWLGSFWEERWEGRALDILNRQGAEAQQLLVELLRHPRAVDRFWAWCIGRLPEDWVAETLFFAAPERAWRDVLERLLADDGFARDLFQALTPRVMALTDIEDPEVAFHVCRRLTLLFPNPRLNEAFNEGDGIPELTPFDSLRGIRRDIMDSLVSKGEAERVRTLVDEFPGHFRRGRILDAQRVRAKRDWKPITVPEAAHFERRLRTSADLLDRVDEAFEDIEKDLNGELAAWDAFFDHAHEREDKRTWPKHETTACTLLADRLRSKLSELSFKALKVEPQEVGGQDRIDIELEVPGEEGNPLTLKVEVKWATNTDKKKGVEAAMESQLVDRYLNHPEDLAGLYLVLWPGPLTGADVPVRWRDDPERLDKLLQAQVVQLKDRHPDVALRARVLRLGARRSSR